MKINKSTDGVLVCDRYYASKPKAALLIIERILLCVMLAVCPMMFVLTEYELQVSLPLAAAVGAAFAAGLSVIFLFVKKVIALPVLAGLAGLFAYTQFDWLSSRLTYFADAFMLLVEGRFLFPKPYLIHDEVLLNMNNPLYKEGVTLGCVLLCVIFALVCALSMSGKLRAVPPIVTFGIYCVPVFISERIDFNLWLIPTLALFAACVTINRCYHDGLAVKHFGRTAYERLVKQEERRFIENTRRAPFEKRLEMRTNFFSKYFSTGMYCAALFSVLLLISSSFFTEGMAIDYTPLYEWAMSIGSDVGDNTPFEEGPTADYFTSSDDTEISGSGLNIVSPGRGEREIIRVSYTGDRPIYLRGDIGVDFMGSSWSSLVVSEPELWFEKELNDSYRPCELEVVQAMLEARGANSDIILRSDVNIEYLCETNVVFLPNYTAEYAYYSNGSFNIYGDFAVRADNAVGSYMNSVDCTALIPEYICTESGESGLDALVRVEQEFSSANVSVNDIYATAVPALSFTPNLFTRYEEYVSEVYTSIPDDVKGQVLSFMEREGLTAEIDELISVFPEKYVNLPNYITAEYLSAYLRDNYTYTLDAVNFGGNAVLNFLTTTKRGHCSLYASALTLMLRSRGIPARYCTGFYVSPTEGVTGGTAVLKEKNTHAWVEVYMGQTGWVTFDPTSASAGEVGGAPTTAPDIAEPTKEPDTSTTEQESKEATIEPTASEPTSRPEPTESSASEEPEKSDLKAFIPFAIAVPAAALIAAVIVVLARKYSRLKLAARQGLDRLSEISPEQGAAEGYHLLLEIFAQKGIVPAKGELPQSFFARADRTLGTKLEGSYQLLEAIEFGGRAATEEERDFIVGELYALYYRQIKEKGIRNRIKIMKIISRKR